MSIKSSLHSSRMATLVHKGRRHPSTRPSRVSNGNTSSAFLDDFDGNISPSRQKAWLASQIPAAQIGKIPAKNLTVPIRPSTRQKPAVRTNLQPQFFPQRLALLEALEELFEDADDDGVDADAFGFGPFLELDAGFCADVEELRVGEIHAGLAGLHEYRLFRWSTWLKAKRTILARSPFTRDSSVMLRGDQWGGAASFPAGRPSTAAPRGSLSALPSFCCLLDCHLDALSLPRYSCFRVCVETPLSARHRRVRAVEQDILLNPYKEPVSRPHDNRWLDVQVPARHFHPSWPTCWPTACPTVWPTLCDCRTEEFVPWLTSIPAAKSDVSSAPERIRPQ